MDQESLVPSICPYCVVGCGLYIRVNDGIIAGLVHERQSDQRGRAGSQGQRLS
jgi:anaerobic selenocysteine-containing dehydrogenase